MERLTELELVEIGKVLNTVEILAHSLNVPSGGVMFQDMPVDVLEKVGHVLALRSQRCRLN